MRNRLPFNPAQDGGHILETQARRDAIARMVEDIGAREPFLLVTGEPGTGKTTLVLEAVAGWESRATVAFLANPALTRTEIVEEIARRFGVEPPANATKPQLLACLERVLTDVAREKRAAVVVVDDAHDLPAESLEELRLLANIEARAGRTFEVVLAGLPALEERLSEAAFAPLRQRITFHFQMKPFSHKETRRLLHEAVKESGGDGPRLFPRETCRDVFKLTRGVPRAIIALAAEAVRRAQAQKARSVSCEHVREAAGALRIAADDPSAPRTPPMPEPASEDRDDDPTDGILESPPTADRGAPDADEAPKRPQTPRSARSDESEVVREEAPPPAAKAAPESAPSPPRRGPETVPETAQPPTVDDGDVAGESAPSRIVNDTNAPSTPVQATAPARAAGADSAELVKGPSENDPRVRQWVSRFIGEDEPRFGDLLMAEPHAAAGDEADFEPATHPTVAGRSPRRSQRSWVTPAAFVLLVVVVMAAVALLPNLSELVRGSAGSAPPIAAQGTTKDASADRSAEASGTVPEASPKRSARTQASAESRPSSEPAPGGAKGSVAAAPPSPEAAKPRAAADADSSARSHRPYALDVGTYLNSERAQQERDRLTWETGLQGWVITDAQGGIPVYRVVLGIYSTRQRAEKSADLILSRDLATEARIIPLPPRSQRH